MGQRYGYVLVIYEVQLRQDLFEPIYRWILFHLTPTVRYVKRHCSSENVGLRDATWTGIWSSPLV